MRENESLGERRGSRERVERRKKEEEEKVTMNDNAAFPHLLQRRLEQRQRAHPVSRGVLGPSLRDHERGLGGLR